MPSDYCFAVRKECIEINLERCRAAERRRHGEGVNAWFGSISNSYEGDRKYQYDAAYNGLLRGDMTREEFQQIEQILENAEVV